MQAFLPGTLTPKLRLCLAHKKEPPVLYWAQKVRPNIQQLDVGTFPKDSFLFTLLFGRKPDLCFLKPE